MSSPLPCAFRRPPPLSRPGRRRLFPAGSRRIVLAAQLLTLTFCSVPGVGDALGASWPQYRGPSHNGISQERIRTDWETQPPRLLWRKAIEPGLSSIAVADGRLFTQAAQRSGGELREFCICLEAETGRELWATDVGLADYPNGGVGLDDGPRSTPSVDGDRVYVLNSYLRLACLETATGRELWSRDFVAELGSTVIPWQNAASPLIVGDHLFLNANAPGGRLLAVRTRDGSTAWRAHEDAMTQSTPVFATIAGVAQVLFFTQTGLVAVTPDTGALLWRLPLSYSTSTAASPVVDGDTVYCSAAYGRGAVAARVIREGPGLGIRELWRTPGANMNHWSTPVVSRGHLYGIFGQTLVSLRCVELETGTQKWSLSSIGRGGLLVVGENLLVLAETGQLLLVKAETGGFVELGRVQAANDGKCWNAPAVSDGRLYARSTTEIAAFDARLESPPPSPLQLSAVVSNGGGRLQVRLQRADGRDFDAAALAKITLLESERIDRADWREHPARPTLDGGTARLEIDLGQVSAPRFFRALEIP